MQIVFLNLEYMLIKHRTNLPVNIWANMHVTFTIICSSYKLMCDNINLPTKNLNTHFASLMLRMDLHLTGHTIHCEFLTLQQRGTDQVQVAG